MSGQPVRPLDIVGLLALDTGVSVSEIIGRDRSARITLIRHIAMWLLRNFTPMSYPEIGRIFGRDHTTVICAVKRVEKLRAELIEREAA